MATSHKLNQPGRDRTDRPEVERTEHPHVVRRSDIAGGRPVIEGTRIRVELIAGFHRKGVTPEEIVDTYPHLRPAQVYDAISYYLDHQNEIDREVEDSIPHDVRDRYGLVVEGAKITDKPR